MLLWFIYLPDNDHLVGRNVAKEIFHLNYDDDNLLEIFLLKQKGKKNYAQGHKMTFFSLSSLDLNVNNQIITRETQLKTKC